MCNSMLDKQTDSPTGRTQINTDTLNQSQKRDCTLTQLDSVFESGMRPPRPAYTPSLNGNLYTYDMAAMNRRGHPAGSKWQSRLQDMLTPTSSRAYAMGCVIITLLLLTVLLIFYFLGEMSHYFLSFVPLCGSWIFCIY